MANFTTDGQICIDRQIIVSHNEDNFDDLIQRFEVIETCKWITDNSYSKVNNCSVAVEF